MHFSDNHQKIVLSQKNWLYVLKEEQKKESKQDADWRHYSTKYIIETKNFENNCGKSIIFDYPNKAKPKICKKISQ